MGKKIINPLLEVKDKAMNVINPYVFGGLDLQELFSLDVPKTGTLTDEKGNALANPSNKTVIENVGGINVARFNGVDSILSFTNSDIKNSQVGSMVIWVRLLTQAGLAKHYFDMAGTSGTMMYNTFLPTRIFRHVESVITNEIRYGSGAISPQNGVWYQFTTVCDGSTVQGYINGVLQTGSDRSLVGTDGFWWADYTPANYKFQLGGIPFVSILNGYISILKMTNKVLTGDEALQFFNSTKAIHGL